MLAFQAGAFESRAFQTFGAARPAGAAHDPRGKRKRYVLEGMVLRLADDELDETLTRALRKPKASTKVGKRAIAKLPAVERPLARAFPAYVPLRRELMREAPTLATLLRDIAAREAADEDDVEAMLLWL